GSAEQGEGDREAELRNVAEDQRLLARPVPGRQDVEPGSRDHCPPRRPHQRADGGVGQGDLQQVLPGRANDRRDPHARQVTMAGTDEYYRKMMTWVGIALVASVVAALVIVYVVMRVFAQ